MINFEMKQGHQIRISNALIQNYQENYRSRLKQIVIAFPIASFTYTMYDSLNNNQLLKLIGSHMRQKMPVNASKLYRVALCRTVHTSIPMYSCWCCPIIITGQF